VDKGEWLMNNSLTIKRYPFDHQVLDSLIAGKHI
jgi:hypothetical protein